MKKGDEKPDKVYSLTRRRARVRLGGIHLVRRYDNIPGEEDAFYLGVVREESKQRAVEEG